MSRLKEANVWTTLVWHIHDEGFFDFWLRYEHLSDRSLAWGLAYDKPSEGVPRKFNWRVSKWRPDERLHTLFQNIGRQQYSDDLLEEWTDEQYGNNLVGRESSSDYEVLPRI